ncbi:armadillo repeat-containing protein 4 [Arapaima gigas]
MKPDVAGGRTSSFAFAMGVALTRAVQWTTAASQTGKLEMTPLNESLLTEIICFVEQLSSKHPQEAHFVFQEPLKWTTTLEPSDFSVEYDVSGSTVKSLETDSGGHPLLQLSDSTISVYTFSELSKTLQLANDKRFSEACACLEENRDPVAQILGPSSAVAEATDTSEDMNRENETKMKLCVLLQQLDTDLLNNSLKEIPQDVRRSLSAVKNDVEVLKGFCGGGDTRLLLSVDYTSDFEFSNGCRAPPWRQGLGEMCYLVVQPCDVRPLHVTCSTDGVFLNRGATQEGEEDAYERKGDVFRDLATLLKHSSPYFAENVDRQVRGEGPSTQKSEHVESIDAEEGGQRSYEHQKKNVQEKARQQPVLSRPGSKNKIEPSLIRKSAGSASPDSAEEDATRTRGAGEKGTKTRGSPSLEEGKKKAVFSSSSVHGRQSLQKPKTPGGWPEADDLSESSSGSEEDEEQLGHCPDGLTDLPSEYWQIQKLVKYLKVTATLILKLCVRQSTEIIRRSPLGCRVGKGIHRRSKASLTSSCRVKRLNTCCRSLRSYEKNTRRREMKQRRNEDKQSRLAGLDRTRRSRASQELAGRVRKTLLKQQKGRRNSCGSGQVSHGFEVCRAGLWSKPHSVHPRQGPASPQGGNLSHTHTHTPKQAKHVFGWWVETGAPGGHACSNPPCPSAPKCDSKRQSGFLPQSFVGADRRNEVRNRRGCEHTHREAVRAFENSICPLLARRGTVHSCSVYRRKRSSFFLTAGLDNSQMPGGAAAPRKHCGICTTPSSVLNISRFSNIRFDRLPTARVSPAGVVAIYINIQNAKQRCDAGEMVRSFVGGLELIVNLLKSTNKEVLASVCAAIANIAKDEENLAVITDHGVVPMLAKLANTADDRLRRHLAEAIAQCCMWGTNRVSFGEAGAVAPLVGYLRSSDTSVHQATAEALFQLSKDPNNCITMHENGAVKLLLGMMGSTDEVLQEAAAGCVANIRRLALANEKARYS